MEESKKRKILRISVWIICCLLIIGIIGGETYLKKNCEIAYTTGNSMGDSVSQGYGLMKKTQTPVRGDIAIFYLNYSPEETICKRIIAVEGDTVHIDNEAGKVYVNGVMLDEPYVTGGTYSGISGDDIVVPEGKVFLMGDNRDISLDSRDLGLFSTSDMAGTLICPVKVFLGFYVIDFFHCYQ